MSPAVPFTVLTRAGLAGALLLAAVSAAPARDGVNAAILGGAAAGVLGGVAAGALLGNQPPPPRVYAPPPPRPVYIEPREVEYVRPVRGPICHYERRKVWLDDGEFTYRRAEVCE